MYPWPERDGPSSDRCNLGYEGSEGLMPVDALKDGATPEGVLNMLGNAAEWCEEKYEPGHRDIDDKTPGMRKFPTIRGGSFLDPYDNTMRNARATMRANADPASGGEDIGIRVVVPFEGT
jgi:formylglycine-generating enzyme required for sulfatase activity